MMSHAILQCPACSSAFQVTAEMIGRQVACPSCQATVIVPADLSDSKNPTDAVQSQASAQPTIIDCPKCHGQFGITTDMRHSGFACPHCHAEFPGQVTYELDGEPLANLVEPSHAEMFAPGLHADSSATSMSEPLGGQQKPDPNDQVNSPELATAITPAPNSPGSTEPQLNRVKTDEAPDVIQMLPPRFLAEGPESDRGNSDSIFLPEAEGGTQRIDSRVVTVEYRGQTVNLISRSPEAQRQYRWIVNLVSILIGLIMIGIAIAILVW